ncbi:MAG TPA: hypothetical protein PKI14_10460 [Fervidobacterium sp.]|jgi:hypothetical protein|nr:hypothetical protein [Fervidobacterium sp.]
MIKQWLIDNSEVPIRHVLLNDDSCLDKLAAKQWVLRQFALCRDVTVSKGGFDANTGN